MQSSFDEAMRRAAASRAVSDALRFDSQRDLERHLDRAVDEFAELLQQLLKHLSQNRSPEARYYGPSVKFWQERPRTPQGYFFYHDPPKSYYQFPTLLLLAIDGRLWRYAGPTESRYGYYSNIRMELRDSSIRLRGYNFRFDQGEKRLIAGSGKGWLPIQPADAMAQLALHW